MDATTAWLGPSPQRVYIAKRKFIRNAATDMRDKDKGCWSYKFKLLSLLYERVGRFTDTEDDVEAR